VSYLQQRARNALCNITGEFELQNCQICSTFVFRSAPVAISNRSAGGRPRLTWGKIRTRDISAKLNKFGITKKILGMARIIDVFC